MKSIVDFHKTLQLRKKRLSSFNAVSCPFLVAFLIVYDKSSHALRTGMRLLTSFTYGPNDYIRKLTTKMKQQGAFHPKLTKAQATKESTESRMDEKAKANSKGRAANFFSLLDTLLSPASSNFFGVGF